MKDDTLSYWHKTAKTDKYPKLEKNIETDVLIVGAGITGITCAYCLAQKGLKPVVIEEGDICDGTTGNTTGKLTIQHNIIYSNIALKYGMDIADKYAESQGIALDFVRDKVQTEHIDCQLAGNTAYVYATTDKEKSILKREYGTAKRIGIDAEFIDSPTFPPKNRGMLGFKNQAVFHPVRFVNALAKIAYDKGAAIYCGTKAVKIKGGDEITALCSNGIKIKARHLVQATQYPAYDGLNLFYTRLYAKRSYGIAVLPKRSWPDGSYINVGSPVRSLRTHNENGQRILIVAGESHPTARGEHDSRRHFENLYNFAENIAGTGELLAKWSAQDYETPDQIPYIGRLSEYSNIYIAAGFKKWGLLSGVLAGNMIADLIAHGSCRYEKLYSQQRKDFTSSPGKATAEILSSVGELIKSKFKGSGRIHDMKQGDGKVINFEGHKAGIYRGYDDSVTVLDITCTHMGTELIFNDAEKTWDCPAHGGRFSPEGKLLEGPPKKPLKILFKGRFTDLADS